MYEQHTAGVIRRHHHVDWRLTGAYIIAAQGVGVACACLWLLHSYKVTVQAQITQMSHAIQREHSINANNYKNLGARVDGMAAITQAVAGYNMICSQYLTGPDGGPDTFLFPCTDHKSGS